MNLADYEFSVQEVAASDDGPRFPVLDIRPQDKQAVEFFASVWSRCQQAHTSYDAASSRPPKGWCRWQVTQWAKSDPLEGQHRYAAWLGDVLVGFLNVRLGFPSRATPGTEVVYVEHVATAPGNILTPLWGRRLIGVGTALLAYSVLESVNRGCGGRVGLHAADGDAEAFYLALNRRFGEQLFLHREQHGVPAPRHPRQTNEPGLDQVYLEGEPSGCLTLLEGYRRD